MTSAAPEEDLPEAGLPEEDGPPVPPSPEYARRQNIVAAIIPLAIGVITGIMSWNLGLGTLDNPGPGLWPLAVSVAMVVTAAVLVLRSRPTGEEEKFTREALIVVVAAVSLVGYALLFERIGFEIPTVALLVLWLRGLGREGWRMTAIISLGSTAALYLLFVTGLGVSLPHILPF